MGGRGINGLSGADLVWNIGSGDGSDSRVGIPAIHKSPACTRLIFRLAKRAGSSRSLHYQTVGHRVSCLASRYVGDTIRSLGTDDRVRGDRRSASLGCCCFSSLVLWRVQRIPAFPCGASVGDPYGRPAEGRYGQRNDLDQDGKSQTDTTHRGQQLEVKCMLIV